MFCTFQSGQRTNSPPFPSPFGISVPAISATHLPSSPPECQASVFTLVRRVTTLCKPPDNFGRGACAWPARPAADRLARVEANEASSVTFDPVPLPAGDSDGYQPAALDQALRGWATSPPVRALA